MVLPLDVEQSRAGNQLFNVILLAWLDLWLLDYSHFH